jgi:hypothetical protein
MSAETVDQRAIWDAVKVGDPRPPALNGLAHAFAGGKWQDSAVGPNGFVCCRLAGHSGQCVATTEESVVAVWSGTEERVAELGVTA